ncbi:MAG: hypothetical protein WCB31_03435 [Nitrososphaeraceae archaeon]
MSSANNIYPKTCGYGCNTQIYWNTSVNEYWEVLSQKNIFVLTRQVVPILDNKQQV